MVTAAGSAESAWMARALRPRDSTAAQARDGANASELTAVVNGAMAAWSGYDKGVSPE